ncbi:unnamed protein product [Rangifer tarandus platyrhynchus]|uniref:Uncharacterized protein n=1 Tax=Rangifer tarandus platyrhynchus TaxID=3082113 RepID=A0AC59Y957_RANTA
MHTALKLCVDKVSEVWWISFKLVVAILQKFCSNNDSALGFCFIMNSSYGSGTVLSGSEGKHLLSFVSLPATCPPVPVF